MSALVHTTLRILGNWISRGIITEGLSARKENTWVFLRIYSLHHFSFLIKARSNNVGRSSTTKRRVMSSSFLNLERTFIEVTFSDYHVWTSQRISDFFHTSACLIEVDPRVNTHNAGITQLFLRRRHGAVNGSDIIPLCNTLTSVYEVFQDYHPVSFM